MMIGNTNSYDARILAGNRKYTKRNQNRDVVHKRLDKTADCDSKQPDGAQVMHRTHSMSKISEAPVVNRVIFPCIHDKSKHVSGLLRSKSDTCLNKRRRRRTRKTNFISHVTVHEYEITDDESKFNLWFSPADLRMFKREATNEKHRQGCNLVKAASCPVQDVDTNCDKTRKLAIRSILIAESRVIVCLLLWKSLKKVFPDARLATAHSVEEADRLISREKDEIKSNVDAPTHGFDVIIVGDRFLMNCDKKQDRAEINLNPAGLQLLRNIDSEEKSEDDVCDISVDGTRNIRHPRYSYLIGLSNNEGYRKELKLSGADTVWAKPPSMNSGFVKSLLKCVIDKRKCGFSGK
mmetsp:Transcript_26817/g.32504  ORF Transcript_26817/g.32504 Transcript_26817/m.32504 type:complete len:350 (-) Transcript_26817:237-1286(-)